MPKINFPTPTQTGLLNAAALAPEGVAEDGCQICGYCESKYPCHPRPPLVTPDCETRNIESVEVGGRSLRTMLRTVRAKDSTPALRNLCQEVNSFPCCCACCHCDSCEIRVERYQKTQLLHTPSRRKGTLAHSMFNAAAAADEGDYYDGGNGWNDDGGGFGGTAANVENCLYIMAGPVHDEDLEKRIICLQQGSRFLVPQVLVSSHESTSELKSTWPLDEENLFMSISTNRKYTVQFSSTEEKKRTH